MTDSDVGPYLAPMREFMRQTRDPEFRCHLQHVGWTPEQDVVIAFDEEPVANVVSRLAFNEASSPCLIAIPHDDEPNGFRLIFMVAAKSKRRRRGEQVQVSPQTSIGMLYTAACHEAYMPADWVGAMTFTRAVDHAAA